MYALISENTVVKWPYTLEMARADNPLMIIPDDASDEELGEHGIVLPAPTPPPSVNEGQAIEEADPAFIDGVLTQQWAVRDKTPEEFAEAKARKQAELRERRWMAVDGGTVIGGVPIRTDEASQNKIDGAISLFEKDPTLETIDFEAQPGIWVELDAATMAAIGVGVGRHVQACFSNQKAISLLIEAAEDFADLAAIDLTAGWPS